MGGMVFPILIFTTHYPGGVTPFKIIPCQVSRGRHKEGNVRNSDYVLTFLLLFTFSEYVNQEIQDLRPGFPERPSTLPRKSRIDRRLPNGLSSGHSVENPGYLIPVNSTSPAFDNPYYLDLGPKAIPGAVAGDGPAGLESNGGVTRHMNGFVTPTAENPEYLGLADTWSGHT